VESTGTVAIDTKPREFSAQEQELLKAIAEDVMEDIKRRRVLDDRTVRAVAKS
jgi:GAF domain-containing protein